MDTIYFWRHTSPLTGRRVRTRWRMSESEATQRLMDPERVEYGALDIHGPALVMPAGSWRSGLELREDGAMMPPATSPADPSPQNAPSPP